MSSTPQLHHLLLAPRFIVSPPHHCRRVTPHEPALCSRRQLGPGRVYTESAMSPAALAPPPPNVFRVPRPFSAVPPSANLPTSLQVVEPSVLRALEVLWRQIELEALDPLLTAEPREGLKQAFETVYPRFFSYYVA